jgi:hypothetical protein
LFHCFSLFTYLFLTLHLFPLFFLFLFRSLIDPQMFHSLFVPLPLSLNVYSITFPCICLLIYLWWVYLLSVAVKWILLCANFAEDCAVRFSLFCHQKAHASHCT